MRAARAPRPTVGTVARQARTGSAAPASISSSTRAWDSLTSSAPVRPSRAAKKAPSRRRHGRPIMVERVTPPAASSGMASSSNRTPRPPSRPHLQLCRGGHVDGRERTRGRRRAAAWGVGWPPGGSARRPRPAPRPAAPCSTPAVASPAARGARSRAAPRPTDRSRSTPHGLRPMAPSSRSCADAPGGTATAGPRIPAARPRSGIAGRNIATHASTSSSSSPRPCPVAVARSQVCTRYARLRQRLEHPRHTRAVVRDRRLPGPPRPGGAGRGE